MVLVSGTGLSKAYILSPRCYSNNNLSGWLAGVSCCLILRAGEQVIVEEYPLSTNGSIEHYEYVNLHVAMLTRVYKSLSIRQAKVVTKIDQTEPLWNTQQ